MKNFDEIYKEANSEDGKKDKAYKEAKKKKEKELRSKLDSLESEAEGLEDSLNDSIINPHKDTFNIKVELELKNKEIDICKALIKDIFPL